MSAELRDATDWELALAGDGAGFARIFDRHRNRLYRHSLRLVPGPADADDVVAITFLEAWRRRAVVRMVDGSMLPWLIVAATNAAHNVRRSSRRHQALLARLPPDNHVSDHAEEGLDEGEAQKALRMLSLPDRRVITLCVLEGLSEKEAASVLGIPQGTVKSRLSRAKKRLSHRVSHYPRNLLAKEAPYGL